MRLTMGRPVTNKYHCPRHIWDYWQNAQRKMYNDMMYAMRPSMQFSFLAPKALPIRRKEWDHIRHNAAYEAADLLGNSTTRY